MSSQSTSLNLLASYLKAKYYIQVPFATPTLGIYYNSYNYEILSVIPFEHKVAIAYVMSFSDYIVLLSEADKKIDYPDDLSIGIIYIEPKSQSNIDAITVVRLPALQVTDSQVRRALLFSMILIFFLPSTIYPFQLTFMLISFATLKYGKKTNF